MKEKTVFCGFFAILFMAYLPVLSHSFLFHDDYIAVLWNRNFLSHYYLIPNLQEGRFVTALLNIIENYWLYYNTSNEIRMVSVLLLSFISYINYRFFISLGYARLASFTLVTLIATLPPFQATIFGITSGQFILFGIFFSQFAFIQLQKNRNYLALIFLVLAQCTYYASSGFFLAYLIFYLMSPNTSLNNQTLRKAFHTLGFYLITIIITHISIVITLKLLHFGTYAKDTGRSLTAINHNIIGQIWFYISELIPKTASLWHIEYTIDKASLVSILVYGFVLIGAMLGFYGLIRGKKTNSAPSHSILTVILILISLVITTAPMLAAFPGRFAPYRTLIPHMSILFFLSFYGSLTILHALTFKLSVHKHINYVIAASAIISAAYYNAYILNNYFVISTRAEREYILKFLDKINNQTKYINIYLLRDKGRPTFLPYHIEDGWGISTTFFDWSIPYLVSILENRGVSIKNFELKSSGQVLIWPEGQIHILTEPVKNLPSNAILIDMHKMPSITWSPNLF
ncbi:MAG: hypothetical protein K0R24_214 [Gammaproteobacteria bacterium]|jgi:hypothetical protein|nr:hypothetical protein [Gammaproteobacteria bacterium]